MTDFKAIVRNAAMGLGLSALYFRFVEWRMKRGREAPPAADADGVPIPPLELMARVVAYADWRQFLATGEATARSLDRYAAEAGINFADAARILDLGCGAGRVIRHLPKLTDAALFGVDYNPSLAGWCAKNLKGDFRRNELRPPLDFPEAHFDIIYLISVFTHLRIPTQREWLAEVARVTRPGGVVLVTFHDENQPGLPDTDEARTALKLDGVFIHNDRIEGSNFIATFQTEAFTRALMQEQFDVVRIVPRKESTIGQTLAILRKRS
ncbi:MAG: class I SAM-dependent methyltransferase [Amphiplicatus sp.]